MTSENTPVEVGPQWPTWSEHDAMHSPNPWSSSENGRYVLDEFDADHLFCGRCGLRIRRPTRGEVEKERR